MCTHVHVCTRIHAHSSPRVSLCFTHCRLHAPLPSTPSSPSPPSLFFLPLFHPVFSCSRGSLLLMFSGLLENLCRCFIVHNVYTTCIIFVLSEYVARIFGKFDFVAYSGGICAFKGMMNENFSLFFLFFHRIFSREYFILFYSFFFYFFDPRSFARNVALDGFCERKFKSVNQSINNLLRIVVIDFVHRGYIYWEIYWKYMDSFLARILKISTFLLC